MFCFKATELTLWYFLTVVDELDTCVITIRLLLLFTQWPCFLALGQGFHFLHIICCHEGFSSFFCSSVTEKVVETCIPISGGDSIFRFRCHFSKDHKDNDPFDTGKAVVGAFSQYCHQPESRYYCFPREYNIEMKSAVSAACSVRARCGAASLGCSKHWRSKYFILWLWWPELLPGTTSASLILTIRPRDIFRDKTCQFNSVIWMIHIVDMYVYIL